MLKSQLQEGQGLKQSNVVGVNIVAKNDYCDSIDIAGSTIAILLLLWTTIAIVAL